MTVLKFPAAPVPVLATSEETRGAELTAVLKALPDQGVGGRIAASDTTELLKEAYGVYWANGRAQAGVAASMVAFAAALPFLSDDRVDHWMSLVRYAVDVEMKHWGDAGYVLAPDHAYEVLVDLADYLDTDEDRAEASWDNRESWAALADTVTCLALAENALSYSKAA